MYMSVCVCECMLLCHSMCAEIRGQSAGLSSLPSRGSQRPNSGSQAWWQELLPDEPSHCFLLFTHRCFSIYIPHSSSCLLNYHHVLILYFNVILCSCGGITECLCKHNNNRSHFFFSVYKPLPCSCPLAPPEGTGVTLSLHSLLNF